MEKTVITHNPHRYCEEIAIKEARESKRTFYVFKPSDTAEFTVTDNVNFNAPMLKIVLPNGRVFSL